MRYPEDHKDRSRARILGSASKLLRGHGIAGVSVAAAMKDAGLTHGAFYAHFQSKDELVAEAIRFAMTETLAHLRDAVKGQSGRQALQTILGSYLAEWHVQKPWNGCAVAHLSQEVSRAADPVRQALGDRADDFIAFIAEFMPDRSGQARRARAAGVYATMVGGVALASTCPSPQRREEILASARSAALHYHDAGLTGRESEEGSRPSHGRP